MASVGRRMTYLFGGMALAAALALAACASRGEEQAPITPEARETPMVRETPEKAGPQEALQELRQASQELSQRWQKASARIAYRLQSESDGQREEGTLVLYWNAPNWRLDLRDGDQGTLLHRDGESYFCSA